MNRIVFDNELIKVMSLFEAMTNARLKDCIIEEEKLTFVVDEGEISRAIGRGGSNIRRIEGALNRKVRIVEFNPESTRFIRNLFYPSKIRDIIEGEGVFTIIPEDMVARGYLIGRGGQNLRSCEAIARRYFEVKEIKVK